MTSIGLKQSQRWRGLVALALICAVVVGVPMAVHLRNRAIREDLARRDFATLQSKLENATRAEQSYGDTADSVEAHLAAASSVIQIAGEYPEEFPLELRVALSSSITVLDRLHVDMPRVELGAEFGSVDSMIVAYRRDPERSSVRSRAEIRRLGDLTDTIKAAEAELTAAIETLDQQVLALAHGAAQAGEGLIAQSGSAAPQTEAELREQLDVLSRLTDPLTVGDYLTGYVVAAKRVRSEHRGSVGQGPSA